MYMKILKNADKKTRDEVDEARKKLSQLKSQTDDKIIDWTESFTNNGAGKVNMETRYNILVNLNINT